VNHELSSMEKLLHRHADVEAFAAMDRWARSTLGQIGALVSRGVICPSMAEQEDPDSRFRSRTLRPLRLGVFPIAADPLHWLHVLTGLAAMENLRLDKVVYVVAGEDRRKPMLAPEQFRHLIAREVLKLFSPLLEYSAIALGSAADGEENVFRIIASFPGRPLHAFYIAGSDHNQRFVSSSGDPDTIQKLERGAQGRLLGFNPRNHKLSVVFLDRGGHLDSTETFLDVHWVRALPLQTSSTRIRDALAGKGPLLELSFLPYSAFRIISTHGLYLVGRRKHIYRS
jgi:hypothetical protein